MRITIKALLLSAASLAIAGGAQAAVYTGPTTYFYLTGSYNASFRIDTGSTIVDPNGVGFQIRDVVGNYPGSSVGYAADVTFFNDADGGGLEIDDNYGSFPIGPLVVTDGPQLFTGSVTAPVFTLGDNIMLTEFEGSGMYNLRVTNIAPPVAAVPEPATWMLAIVGFGAIGVAMRRSNRNVAVRFAV